MKFCNRYLPVFIGIIISLIVVGCGGQCDTNNTQQVLYTFPNGTQLYGVTSSNVSQGANAQPSLFILKGGSPGLNVNLIPVVNYGTSLNSQHVASTNVGRPACTLLCVDFNPSVLAITGGDLESSTYLDIASGAVMPTGSYQVNITANYQYDGKTYYNVTVATVTINVTQNQEPLPIPAENGAYIQYGIPSIQAGFTYSLSPSQGFWTTYSSGTTAGISAIASNSSATLAVHASYRGESAGFLFTNSLNGQLFNQNNTQLEKSLGGLSNALAVANENGFVIYNTANSGFYFVDNSANVTSISNQFTGLTIDTIANLNGIFYAFDYTDSKLLSSTDGISWNLVNGATISAKFTKVINVSGIGCAALSDAGVVYTGANPAAITAQQSLTYTAQQIAANGTTLVTAQVASNGDGTAYFYHPTESGLGSSYNSMQINLVQYIPGADSSLVTNYKIKQLFLTNSSVYALGEADFANVLHLSAAISGDTSSNKTAIVSLTSVDAASQTANYGQTATLINNQLLLANTDVGIAGKLINDVSNPNSANNGSMTLLRSINYAVMGTESNVAVSYDNLPTGNKFEQFMGLAGSAKYFAFVTKNGGVVAFNNGVFTLGSTIVNTTVAPAVPDTLAGLRGVNNNTLLAYANATNLGGVSGSGNLYYSTTNGLSWQTIALASLPHQNSQGELVGTTVAVAGNQYLITTFDAANNKANYLTATPTQLASWLLVPSNANPNLVALNSQLLAFTNSSESFAYLSNGAWIASANGLPAAFESSTGPSLAPVMVQNITTGMLSNNVTYALVESGSANIWSTNDVISGTWTSQTVNFYVDNSIFSGKTFPTLSPTLVWTGKVWLTTDDASFVYSNIANSNDILNYYIATLNNDGTSYIVGTPVLF